MKKNILLALTTMLISSQTFAIYCLKKGQVVNPRLPEIYSCIIKNHRGKVCPSGAAGKWVPVDVSSWVNIDVSPFPPENGAEGGNNCCIKYMFSPTYAINYITDDSCQSLSQGTKMRIEKNNKEVQIKK
jgi:hypothetical protein